MSDIRTVVNEFKVKLLGEYNLIKEGKIELEVLELLDNVIHEYDDVIQEVGKIPKFYTNGNYRQIDGFEIPFGVYRIKGMYLDMIDNEEMVVIRVGNVDRSIPRTYGKIV